MYLKNVLVNLCYYNIVIHRINTFWSQIFYYFYLHFTALKFKGVVFYDLDRYGEALECYNQVLDLDPNFFEAWANKTATLGNLVNFKMR